MVNDPVNRCRDVDIEVHGSHRWRTESITGPGDVVGQKPGRRYGQGTAKGVTREKKLVVLQLGIFESGFDFALDRFELVKIPAVHFNFFRTYRSLDQIGFDVCFDVLETGGLGTAKSEDRKILARVAADKGLCAGFGIVEGLPTSS